MNPAAQDKITQFFAAYPQRTYGKRQLLLRPAEPLPGIFYLAEGRVSAYDITPAGNEVVVNVFKPGAFFPMSMALNDTPNSYFYETSIDTTVRIAPVADVLNFMADNPDVTLDLLKRVYRGVDGVLRRMAHLMGGDAQHRLLFEILNAAYRFGEREANGAIRVPLTESEIGKYAGLARETVNRTMHAFKAEGLLEVTHKSIIIPDIKKLEKSLGDSV